MRIALVGAEFEENLAVRCIRAALSAAGHEVVQVIFNRAEDTELAARELAGSGARLAGFSMVFTRRARQFADLARRAREHGFRGHIVAGGHFAAFNAERLLADVPALDSVALGEGEELMCALAERIERPGEVAGLVQRAPDGRIVRNAPAEKPTDLDARPEPVHKEPFDSYLGLPIANLLGSRGCAHNCAFCSIAAWHRLCGGARLRLRSVASLADEMAGLWRRGVRIFNFHDDNFFLPRREATIERMSALRDELAARGVGRIAFATKCRPDGVDEELFRFMKSLGMFRVFLGIEAGTAESLTELGRGQETGDNERALEVVDRLDIHACFNLLMLNPDSTLEDFAANVAFLRAHPKNPMNFCRTEIYAGTPLEEKLRREGRLLGDYWGYDYRVRDPRAQEIFEVVYPAFVERNFGERGLHHLAMGVDYEHQLLSHFLGTSARLRRRVKGFIVEVNRNTCAHLEAGVAAVVAGFPSEAARRKFREDLTRRVGADNERLYPAGRALVREIRASAEESRSSVVSRRRGALRTAAAGLLATSVALSAGCGKDNTQAHEVAAQPPHGPKGDQPLPPEGDAKLIKAELFRKAGVQLPRKFGETRDIRIELWLDAQGKVTHAAVRGAALTPEKEKEALAYLRSLAFQTPEAAGKRFSVPVSREELRDLDPGSHIYEMAPTHFMEEIVRPPDGTPEHGTAPQPPPPPPPPPKE